MEKELKAKARFRSYHSTMDHLVTLRIIVEECHNNKTNLYVVSLTLENILTQVPRTNLWNRLEEIKVPLS
jgi:hypothetical protein